VEPKRETARKAPAPRDGARKGGKEKKDLVYVSRQNEEPAPKKKSKKSAANQDAGH
jgi:hypothetical protein